jgi:hypothetical protein
MKKQPFLEFVCEIMAHSPCGKRIYGRQRNVPKATGDDVLEFLDINNPTYRIEAEFLLKHCKRKCVYFAIKKTNCSVQLDLRVRSQDANKPITYEIVKLGKPASQQEFPWKVNKTQTRTITVQNYYKEHYDKALQWVNKIPCSI